MTVIDTLLELNQQVDAQLENEREILIALLFETVKYKAQINTALGVSGNGGGVNPLEIKAAIEAATNLAEMQSLLEEILAIVSVPGENAYDFTQSTPATTWTIAHNAGQRMTPRTFNVGGLEILGTVQHLSLNVVQVSFLTPQSGFARIS